ncbi:MAG: tetratricopeptide repeat protein [Ignavibacteriae bacterium]|nr:tetratricopeptide repeat protein [Ignavibacteriota bacterium]
MARSLVVIFLVIVVCSLTFTGFQCGSSEMTSAKLYIQRQDWEAAERSLLKEIQNNPNNAEAWYLLGDTRARLANYRGMLDAVTSSLKLSKEYEERIKVVKLFGWQQALNEGVNRYNQSVKASPDSAAMLRQQAIDSYKLVIEINSDSVITYQNMAIAQHAHGNYDEEIVYLKKALERKKDPQFVTYLINAYLQKGSDAKKAGNTQQAEEYFDLAIKELIEVRKENPNDPELLGTLINVHIEAGRAQDGMPYIREAVEKEPNNKVYQNDLGLLLLETGELEEAITHFDASIAADSTYQEALRNGAVTYMRLGQKIKEAADAKADPKKGSTDKTHLEKFKKAVVLLEKLTSMKSDDPDIWEALGTAYANAGMVKKAEEAIKTADALRNR